MSIPVGVNVPQFMTADTIANLFSGASMVIAFLAMRKTTVVDKKVEQDRERREQEAAERDRERLELQKKTEEITVEVSGRAGKRSDSVGYEVLLVLEARNMGRREVALTQCGLLIPMPNSHGSLESAKDERRAFMKLVLNEDGNLWLMSMDGEEERNLGDAKANGDKIPCDLPENRWPRKWKIDLHLVESKIMHLGYESVDWRGMHAYAQAGGLEFRSITPIKIYDGARPDGAKTTKSSGRVRSSSRRSPARLEETHQLTPFMNHPSDLAIQRRRR